MNSREVLHTSAIIFPKTNLGGQLSPVVLNRPSFGGFYLIGREAVWGILLGIPYLGLRCLSVQTFKQFYQIKGKSKNFLHSIRNIKGPFGIIFLFIPVPLKTHGSWCYLLIFFYASPYQDGF